MTQKRFCKWYPDDAEDCYAYDTECGHAICMDPDADIETGVQCFYCRDCGFRVNVLKFDDSFCPHDEELSAVEEKKRDNFLKKIEEDRLIKLKTGKVCKWIEGEDGYDNSSSCGYDFDHDETEWASECKFCFHCSRPVVYVPYK